MYPGSNSMDSARALLWSAKTPSSPRLKRTTASLILIRLLFNPLPAQDALKRDPSKVPRVDLYGAGPPCQPVSMAGRKRGLVPWDGCLCFVVFLRLYVFKIIDKFQSSRRVLLIPFQADPRSKCYRASFDYIRKRKPKVVLIEQVPGVVHNKRLRKLVFLKWVKMFLGFPWFSGMCGSKYSPKLKKPFGPFGRGTTRLKAWSLHV